MLSCSWCSVFYHFTCSRYAAPCFTIQDFPFRVPYSGFVVPCSVCNHSGVRILLQPVYVDPYGCKYLYFVFVSMYMALHMCACVFIFMHVHILMFILMCIYVFVCLHVYVVLITHRLIKNFQKYIHIGNCYMLNYNMSILYIYLPGLSKKYASIEALRL